MSNQALAKGISALLRDATIVKDAGIPLPEFKAATPVDLEGGENGMLAVPNAAFAELLKGSLSISEIAVGLRKSQGAPSATP